MEERVLVISYPFTSCSLVFWDGEVYRGENSGPETPNCMCLRTCVRLDDYLDLFSPVVCSFGAHCLPSVDDDSEEGKEEGSDGDGGDGSDEDEGSEGGSGEEWASEDASDGGGPDRKRNTPAKKPTAASKVSINSPNT